MKGAHYDEEALIELIERGEAAVARDEHVSACAECAETIASIREFTQALKSDDVWHGPDLNPEPNEQVLATLRAAQARMRAEDAAAETAIKELLAGPRETWMAKLQDHPEWRTAGMVRKLIAATDRAIETMPPDALEITAIAIEIAEKLDLHQYGGEVAALTSAVWRERAFTLYYVGQYHEAIAGAIRGESMLAPAADHQRARLMIVRALAVCELDHFDEALALSRGAAVVFLRFSDRSRFVVALRTEGIVLYRSRRFREALGVFEHLLTSYSDGLDRHARPALLQNIAICHRELGDLAEANHYFVKCAQGFQAAGILTGLYKAKWHLGRTLLAQSRFEDALRVLQEVRDGFEAAGMANDVAMATLDIAHVLVVVGKPYEVADECRRALIYFATAKLEQTSAAATALMFLREVAVARPVNANDVDEARHRLHVADAASRQALFYARPAALSTEEG